ncbi:xyloglucan endotransglucosylase/hydrolase protein 2-like [Impatiens glandulifera]|uniref:xyloglucan endotransglucosylase/hydrolase protein 2-like n=1 Tax=Impatiens glandulifera TaxID=253017 RepID=UPI001FB0DB24|nr:xyloglucan endotransglucosylase/hydrolase protein 2-like [Impatiens glandulifera]
MTCLENNNNNIITDNSGHFQPFDQNYFVTWGSDHFSNINNGKEIQLTLDKSSGAGFQSKLKYASGFFGMRVKIHDQDSAGVLISYYLHSHTNDKNGGDIHDEIDLEFLGNKKGGPYFLQTNVFVNGEGNREHKVILWFDPSADFHTYHILWNTHQIAFFVDNIPIRVFKNSPKNKTPYPTQPLKIEGSIYCADSWVTDGGLTKINWTHAPFHAHYQGFNIAACSPAIGDQIPNQTQINSCLSNKHWWNKRKFWRLNRGEQEALDNVTRKYLHYDYCTDKHRYPIPPPECAL